MGLKNKGSNIGQIRFKTQKGIGLSLLFTEWYPATSNSSLSIKKNSEFKLGKENF